MSSKSDRAGGGELVEDLGVSAMAVHRLGVPRRDLPGPDRGQGSEGGMGVELVNGEGLAADVVEDQVHANAARGDYLDPDKEPKSKRLDAPGTARRSVLSV